MKYKLLQNLPFLKAGSIFERGNWVGGGFGVDRGYTKYGCGYSSHNGVRTFSEHENNLLESILNDADWIEKIPANYYEIFDLYDAKIIDRKKAMLLIKNMDY